MGRTLSVIKEIHAFLSDEIKQMNELMISSLNVEEELVTIIGNHLAQNGGKRIRPVLTLLTGKMFGCSGTNHINLAAAVEFIHLATLLHDDVVDGSKMRRFLPTANVLWGSKASILVGDFLFSQSFRSIVASKSLKALEVLSNSSAIIAEGEVSQLSALQEHRLISESEYIKIISAKTAELFASAAEVGAIVAGADEENCVVARDFGRQIGLNFQVADDALDYFSSADEAGKNTGDDFKEGKVTLPIILLHKKASKQDQKIVSDMIQKEFRTADDFTNTLALLEKYGIYTDIKQYLQEMTNEAKMILAKFDINNQSDAGPDAGQCKKYLAALIEFAAIRSY